MIIHVADLHLGHRGYEKLGLKYNQREEDIYLAWRQFIRLTKEAKPSLVLVAGDLFDSPTPPVAAIIEAQRLWELAPIEVIVIQGNHERARVGEESPVWLVNGRNVRVFDTPQLITTEFGNTIFCAPDTGVAFDLLPANILLAHGQINGPEEYAHQTKYLKINQNDYAYCALGDLHRKYQEGKIRYPGSLCRLTFAQEGLECGFYKVDINTRACEFVTLESRKFITLHNEFEAKEYLANSVGGELVRVVCELPQEMLDRIRDRSTHMKIIKTPSPESQKELPQPKGKTLQEEYVSFCNLQNKPHLIESGLDLLRKADV